MASIAEERLSRALRAVLAGLPDGANIPDSDKFDRFLIALISFIPPVIAEAYREWGGRGLDDIWRVDARKTGDDEAEIFGLCCVFTDQALIPIHLRLQVADSGDRIAWLECRLGERDESGIERSPHSFLMEMTNRFHRLGGDADRVNWAYKVTSGVRRPYTATVRRRQTMSTDFDRTKSLQELEQEDWGEPTYGSHLVTTCHRLHRTPLNQFTAEDLRIMIGQQFCLPYLVPLALEQLENNPLIDGDFYEGDLLNAAVHVKLDFWDGHPDYMERIRKILNRVREMLPGLEEIERDTAVEVLAKARPLLA